MEPTLEQNKKELIKLERVLTAHLTAVKMSKEMMNKEMMDDAEAGVETLTHVIKNIKFIIKQQEKVGK